MIIDPFISDVEFSAPFPAISNGTGTHTTYLDTAGRPKLTFIYKSLTLKHVDHIIVGFTLLVPLLPRSLYPGVLPITMDRTSQKANLRWGCLPCFLCVWHDYTQSKPHASQKNVIDELIL